MAGAFGDYNALPGDAFVSGHFPVNTDERPEYMTGHMYNNDSQLYVNTLQINTAVPPIITTPAGDDAFDDYLSRSLNSSCSPSPYPAQPAYNTGLHGFSDAMLSDPESPHSASGSETFNGQSSVNISPLDDNGRLLPSSQTRSRPRSVSDVHPPANQGHDYSSNGLLSPQPMLGHRRSHSDHAPNPQLYDRYPGGTGVLFDPPFDTSLHVPFDSYRGRPVSRNSSLGSTRSSRRPSPYSSVNSSPAGGNSDLDLSLVSMRLKEEDGVHNLGAQPTQGINVARPQVTTPAIKQASEKRREKPAPHVCEVCGSTFTRKANLIGHMTAHEGKRPYQCEYIGCSKAFARMNDLKRHQRIHDREEQHNGTA